MGSLPPVRDALTLEPGDAVVSSSETQACSKRRKRIQAPASRNAAPPSDLDVSQPSTDWWQPQPRASLDPKDYQDRPREPLYSCLSCVLCQQLLREAITATECGHTYCYDCIEARVVIGGNHNVCPVAGCGVVLGPNPFDHHRLMYDTLLDDLLRKIFPRPELDAALASCRADREEATRQARVAVNGGYGRGHPQSHQHQQRPQRHRCQTHPNLANRTGKTPAPQGCAAPGRRRCGEGGSRSDRGVEVDDEGSDREPNRQVPGTAEAVCEGGGKRYI